MSHSSEKIPIGDRNIVLIGFMGTGKSTVGKFLAKKTRRRFFDTDKLIEKKAGKPVGDIFAQDGEDRFRELESEVIAEVSSKRRLVVSTGGGAVLRDDNVRALKTHGFLVCLESTPESIHRRLARARNRPLLPGGSSDRLDRIRELLRRRRERYRLADLSIDVSERPSKEAGEEILSKIEVG